MTNLIYAAWREPRFGVSEARLRRLAARLGPGGFLPAPEAPADPPGEPRVIAGARSALALTAPSGAAAPSGLAAHTGAFCGSSAGWYLPGSPVPEGTFALIRADEARTELCSDSAGSRTLWYAVTETRFLASTSQRALAALLGGFELEPAAFRWFLSSGSLGPEAAWDRRVRRLPAGARLVFDHGTWAAALHPGAPLRFEPDRSRTAAQAEADLAAALREAFRGYDFRSARWALPLSGGYDCRFLLALLLEQGIRLPTVTWGMAASLHQPGNDAFVARQLAARCGLDHDYLLTEGATAAPGDLLDRFLAASGGTTDQLFPYLDGLALWSGLARRGVDGILRGDEGFGWIPVGSARHARLSVGLARLADVLEPPVAEALGAEDQPLPEALAPQPGESVPAYRDRLYHGFRIPVGLAALNDVKAPFVEIASPFLTAGVLRQVRRVPDALRTDKRLFRRLARAAGPHLPYATSGADDDRHGYLRSPAFSQALAETLASDPGLLPEAFRLRLLAALEGPSGPSTASLRARLKRILPTAWIRAARAGLGPPRPPDRMLALRAALALRMIRLLERDGSEGGRAPDEDGS
ncbi:MAG TPA: hypothetical protein VFT46_02845 [Holophagaceae bacterium]|nr:hypothetical protein [Holophagaceae bacterium]